MYDLGVWWVRYSVKRLKIVEKLSGLYGSAIGQKHLYFILLIVKCEEQEQKDEGDELQAEAYLG